jgi:triosephosphate isomerase
MKFVIGNLKMNILSPIEREQYFKSFKNEISEKKFDNCLVVLCPPVIHLEAFKKLKSKVVATGAQNIFWERSGSFTGEISPSMVKNFFGDYAIVGHSERRRYAGETNEQIGLKIVAALKNGLKPILCVGEDKGGRINDVIVQLKKNLEKVNWTKLENIIICYEPVWAISANNPDHLPTANEIMSARLMIKKFLVENYGKKPAEKVKIIYGGSVTAANVKEVCLDPGMDGVLVGKESLTPYELIKIAEIING